MDRDSFNRNQWIVFFLLLALFITGSRLVSRSSYLYSWDSVNYALSIKEFNIHLHQPHPPGSILYSYTLKLLDLAVHDPNLSMILLNIGAAIGASIFIALLVLEFSPASSFAAMGAAALFATNPIGWFYSSIAEIYPVEAFFASCISYLVIASFRKPSLLVYASAAMAIAGGFRPTTEIFLFPVYLAGFIRKGRRTILLSILALFVLNLAWIFPLLKLSGGFEMYWERIQQQGSRAAGKTGAMLEETSERGPDIRLIPVLLLQACTLPVLSILLIRMKRIRVEKKLLILGLAIFPALIFFMTIHYSKDGYLLLILPAWIALCSIFLSYTVQSRILLSTTLLASVLLNALIFLFSPATAESRPGRAFYLSAFDEFRSPNRNQIRERSEQFEEIFGRIHEMEGTKSLVMPQKSFPSWRTFMYYFPEVQLFVIRFENSAFLFYNQKLIPVHSPFQIGTDWVLVSGPQKPDVPMRSFRLKRKLYFYAKSRALPDEFQVYGSDFVIRKW